jgi:hypothetical protein
MRVISLTKDNYGASHHLGGFRVQREITPKREAQHFVVVHEYDMPTIG